MVNFVLVVSCSPLCRFYFQYTVFQKKKKNSFIKLKLLKNISQNVNDKVVIAR